MVWPIYKKELLSVGNPDSNNGLCTLWTEKERVLKYIDKSNFLIAGQCYSKSEGISLMIRHALANKTLANIVLCGSDLDRTGDALLSLKKAGLSEDRSIVGVPNSSIEEEIPLEAINRFRENVEIFDKRGVTDFSSINDFLSTLPKKSSWGQPEIYERPEPTPPEFFPSEGTGFVLRDKKVADLWLKILDTILKFGNVKKSQYADDQKEITCLTSIITGEDPRNIEWKSWLPTTREHFENYLPQLMTSEIIGNVGYTYGSRLRNHKGINQIDSMVNAFKKAIHSRRAVAVTWDVQQDHDSDHIPCLNLIQALVQDKKMHMTFYIRSNDMFRAWPENAYGFRTIHYELAERVQEETRNEVEVGDTAIISNCAHIYSPNWRAAQEIVKQHLKSKREPDPRGNILIELENSKIKVTHLSPEGRRIGEFYAENARKAYIGIEKAGMVSQTSHALDIGAELGKAETALRLGIKYIQDNPLNPKSIGK